MAMRQFERLLRQATVGFLWGLLLCAPVCATEITRLNLDNADALGTVISPDQKVKFEGNGSIRISTKWPTTICLGQISKLNLESSKLVYQAKVKSENLNGAAFLEMWCQVGGGQYFSRGLNSTVSGTTDWQAINTTFILNKGQKAEMVTLNLVINGTGTVWIDEVQLAKTPLN
ncbi:MAG: hypothetical protein PVH74_05990 [Desulfobacterales bacterium]|jgi:hypothetical protein|nr:hypothetical protein [Deltaproteobacteria bacterium]